MVRVSLDRYLKRHNLTAYRLAQQTAGRVARGSVFALARGEKVRRVDLETLGQVMAALEELTGEPVTPNDLLDVVPVEEPVSPEEEQGWLDAAATDLAAQLDALEADVPPEEHRAWLNAFEQAPTV